MLKNILIAVISLVTSLCWGQKVFFNHMEKVHDNQDRILYRLPEDFSEGEYLGELEVQGFSRDDVDVFSKVYAKAKEIGANTFTYSAIPSVDGTVQKFDPWNYRLKLYYVPQQQIPVQHNAVIILGSPVTDSRVTVNRKAINVPSRTYFRYPVTVGESYRVGSGKLLGSSVQLIGKVNEPVQYFQVDGASVKGEGGFLNFKSGDIVLLERSFADFLTVIYQEIKI